MNWYWNISASVLLLVLILSTKLFKAYEFIKVTEATGLIYSSINLLPVEIKSGAKKMRIMFFLCALVSLWLKSQSRISMFRIHISVHLDIETEADVCGYCSHRTTSGLLFLILVTYSFCLFIHFHLFAVLCVRTFVRFGYNFIWLVVRSAVCINAENGITSEIVI